MSDSDADDGGFDREAERERLREKYERDKEKRESTERMSELLLQGATMTNKHCDTCGNPIFRYQGQEFCPTCQDAARAEAEAETGAGDESPAQGQGAASGADPVTGQETAPESEPAPEAEPEPEPESDAEGAADAPPETKTPAAEPAGGSGETDAPGGSTARPPEGGGAPDRTSDSDSAPDRQSEPAPERDRAASRSRREGAGDREGIASARASLERTLTDLAARAEESRDVGQTRELLAATKEAAEALRELDRV